jgi:hypothetical protein
MPFEILNRRASRASGVAVNVTRNKNAKEGKGLSGTFRLGPDVVKEANWPLNTKVQILVGTGNETGMFILKPSDQGLTKPFKPKNGASLQLSFSAVSAGFTQPTEGTLPIEHHVTEAGDIQLTVPSLRGSVQKKSSKK